VSRLAEIRNSLKRPLEALGDFDFYVTTGKTQFAETGITAQNFIVIATVGELSVKRVLEENRQPHEAVIDVRVVTTSGMRLYPEHEKPPQLGAEWTVECLLEGD
jgi:hypothetical protein